MRILFLQKRILFPTDAGCKVRTLNIVRHLARWHDVTYLCNLQPGEEPLVPAMHDLGVRLETVPWRETSRRSARFYGQLAANLVSSYPFNVNKDFDPRLRARAEELLADEQYDLVICDFVQMARNACGLNVPASILFQHNVEAEIFKRHSLSDSGWLRRRYMQIQWRKMRRFEAAAGRRFDRVIAVSDRDRELFQQEYNWNHVDVIDTAVDTDYFHPRMSEPDQPFRVVFVGSLDWLPNEDGIQFFVSQIWPLIRKRVSRAVFQVVGRNPGPAVTRWHGTDGIEIVGTVPDVRPYLAAASVVVVPLRIGGGTRLKIFEAMAMRKAVVSTTLGAEGLNIRHDQHLLLADDPAAFATDVADLLDNPDRRERLSTEAYQFVREHYSAETVARQFDEICHRTLASREPSSALSS